MYIISPQIYFQSIHYKASIHLSSSINLRTINWLKTMDKTKETAPAKNKGKDPMVVDNSSVEDSGFDATYLKASMIQANTSFYSSVKSAEYYLNKMVTINEVLKKVGYVDAFAKISSGRVTTLINGCKKLSKALDEVFQEKASMIDINVAFIEENVLTDTDEKVVVSEIDLHTSLLLAMQSFKKSVASVNKLLNVIFYINVSLYHAGANEFVLETKRDGFKTLISLVSWLKEAAADVEIVDVPAAVKKSEVLLDLFPATSKMETKGTDAAAANVHDSQMPSNALDEFYTWLATKDTKASASGLDEASGSAVCKDAKVYVAREFLNNVNLEGGNVRACLVEIMKMVQSEVDRVHSLKLLIADNLKDSQVPSFDLTLGRDAKVYVACEFLNNVKLEVDNVQACLDGFMKMVQTEIDHVDNLKLLIVDNLKE